MSEYPKHDLEPIGNIIKRTQKKFRLTPPKPFIPKEYDEQCAIFDYAKIAAKQDPRWKLLFSTLNGVRVSIGLAKKMKRAGNNPGVPDIILPVPRCTMYGQRHTECKFIAGLFIELKRSKGGQVSNEQKWWHEQLRNQGYRVEVCKGAREAIEVITAYLGGGA